MTITWRLWRLPRLPRLRLPRPRPRPLAEPGELSGVLRAARMLALAAVVGLVTFSTVVALAESYHALYVWALHHSVTLGWARWWPAMVDTFVALGELAVFLAVVDQWPWRYRAYAWLVTAGGLAVSVSGNVGHIQTAALANRLTAAVPPVAAFVALTVGMMALKRVLALGRRSGGQMAAAADALAAIGEADTKTVIAALVGVGINDTGTLAAIAGVSDRTVRRHRNSGQEPDSPGQDPDTAGVRAARSRHATGQPRLTPLRTAAEEA
jgi:hypothetical protein